MTRETFDIAKDIIADIDTLKNIKSEYKNGHWVSFYGAVVKEQTISGCGILADDLEEFINKEIIKLEEELEKL